MAFRLLNRARMSLIGTPGTGALTLNAAAAGFQSFTDAGMTDGDTTPYVIEDGSPVGTTWEIGLGAYHSNGTLTRDVVTQSSAGGTTKISVTSNAILSGTFRGVDILGTGGGGGGAGTPPTVVQYKYASGAGFSGAVQIAFDITPTPGNVIVAIGNNGDNDGAHGFNYLSADFQSQQNSTTAFKVGYGYKLVTSANASLSKTVTIGSTTTGKFSGLIMEIAGSTIASLAAANGTFTSSSSSTTAAVAANSLGVIFFGGDGSANPSITVPAAFQISTYQAGVISIQAGWNDISGAGTAGLTGSVASGSNGVLALNIPGT